MLNLSVRRWLHLEPVSTKEYTKQPNGIDEKLRPENRAVAEAYYASKGIGPSAEERYCHFREDPELSVAFYYNFDYDPILHESDIARLAWLEWMKWQWDGSL